MNISYMVRLLSGIILMSISIVLYLLILKLINKKFLKQKKMNLKEILIGWGVIFVINIFCILIKAPFAIGIPFMPYLNAGARVYYISLGYTIEVNRQVIATPGEEHSWQADSLKLHFLP